MPRLHALELLPDADGEARVRRDWQALADAGLPSMLDHRGATNTPHVTVVAVAALGPDDEARAHDLLGPLLPVTVRVSGVVVLGGRWATLARAVEAPDALTRAVLDLRAAVAGEQHRGWLAHLTLARRVPRDRLQEALDLVGHDEVEVTLSSLRRWDPDAGTVTPLVPPARG